MKRVQKLDNAKWLLTLLMCLFHIQFAGDEKFTTFFYAVKKFGRLCRSGLCYDFGIFILERHYREAGRLSENAKESFLFVASLPSLEHTQFRM